MTHHPQPQPAAVRAHALLQLEVSEALLELFNKPNFAVKGLPSPLSVELFAVLKSIIALAAGWMDRWW